MAPGAAERGSARRRIAIACQGGGSHTSFTAGALKGLLETGHSRHEYVAFSGTSGGAICALLAWYALLEHGGGAAGAQVAGRLLESFWLRANAPRGIAERLLNDWLVGWLRLQKATGVLVETSPNLFSDYWQGRLRQALEESVPFGRIGELVKPDSPLLFLGAVEVLTGEFKVFASHRRRERGPTASWVREDDPENAIGVEAVLASAAIPPIFRSVRVGRGVYWDGLFSQNPPTRQLLDARPDEIWVIQINASSMAPRPRDPVPGDEPTSIVDILDRRNALAGNLSLNQELRYVETLNEIVEELGEGDGPGGHRLRLKIKGREYRPVVVRRIEMSWPLGAASKLDRSPAFVRSMMSYGEARAAEFFRALAFEEAWGSRDADAVSAFFATDAEIRLSGPFGERTRFRGEHAVRDFVRQHLATEVRIDPTRKQVAGDAVTWTVRVSPLLSGGEGGEPPAEGIAEAVFEDGKIRSLTLASAQVAPPA